MASPRSATVSRSISSREFASPSSWRSDSSVWLRLCRAAAVAPQQGCQPVTRLFLSRVAGEISEQGFRLARGEPHVPPVGPPDAKAPQQCQLD